MSKNIKLWILHCILIIFVIITILPLVWMLLSSFKMNSEITSITPTFIPKTFTFKNYLNVQKNFNFLRYFANSLFITVVITSIVIYTSTISGFVFAKYEFRGKNILFSIILGTMMIPWCVTIIPRYSMVLAVNGLDTYLAVIIPAAVSGFGIFMMRQSIVTIPEEMLEAARIDGASEWFIFHKIIMPLSQNAISSIAIFQFLWSWEDYLWPYLIFSSEEKQVLAVGLKNFNGRYGTDYGGLFAATTISIIPVIIVYLIFQKRFIDGIAASSVKG